MALVGVFAASVLVAPLRALTWEPLAERVAESGLASALGGEAGIEGLRWRDAGVELSSLAWRGVRPDEHIELDGARVEANWWRLVRGDVSAIRNVTVGYLNAALAFESGADSSSAPSEGPPAPLSLDALPLPDWSVERANVTLIGSGWVLSVVELSTENVARDVQATAANVSFKTGERRILEGALELKAGLAADRWDVHELSIGDDVDFAGHLAAASPDRLDGELALAWQAARMTSQVAWSADELALELAFAPVRVEALPLSLGIPAELQARMDLAGELTWPEGVGWSRASADVRLRLDELRYEEFRAGRLDLRAEGRDGTWRAETSLADGAWGEGLPGFLARLEAEWRDGKCRITGPGLTATDGSTAKLSGEFPCTSESLASLGALPLSATVDVAAPSVTPWSDPRLAGVLDLTLELGGSVESPELALVGTLGGARWETYPEGAVSLDVRARDDVQVKRLELEIPGLAVASGTGAVGLPLDLEAWTGDERPDWRTAQLDGDVEFELPELFSLPLRSTTLRKVSGRFAGKAAVAGSLGAPELTARGELENGRVDFLVDLPSATELFAQVSIEGQVVTLEEGRGALGNGPFEFEGRCDLEPEQPDCRFTIRGENMLFVRSRDALLRGDLDVTAEGALDRLSVAGKVHLTRGLMATRVEFDELLREGRPATNEEGIELFSFTEPPLEGMRFDVAVTSQRDIGLESNVLSARVRPDLRLVGTGEVPELNGVVYVDEATLSLPASSLRVNRGTVRFDPANPFVPELALEGGTKMLGYEISMVTTGPFDEPEIALTSSPSLPSEDVLLLVLTGQLPERARTQDGRADTGQAVALYFGKDLLAKWFASDDPLSDEETLFDRLEFSSGRDVSRQGTPTIDASFRLRKDWIRGDDALYLHVERDVWEDYNAGVRWVVRLR